jgi:hypothetical protein
LRLLLRLLRLLRLLCLLSMAHTRRLCNPSLFMGNPLEQLTTTRPR